MIGKVLKVNDYKFVYGQDTTYINVYGAFKNKKSGNRYAVYSYDNKKLYYGSLFIKNDSLIIMTSKDDSEDVIKLFVESIISGKNNDDWEIVNLGNINSAEIIDQHELKIDVDMAMLADKTIPKPKIEKKEEAPKKKKKVSIPLLAMFILILMVALFLFVGPNFLMGKDKKYLCVKSYTHEEIPASVTDNVSLIFNNKNEIVSIDITTDYLFTNHDYYKEFKDKSYFYQYIKDGDTYKFDDDNYTYKLFSKIDTEVDYFMPRELKKLVDYYEKENYTCNLVEESD